MLSSDVGCCCWRSPCSCDRLLHPQSHVLSLWHASQNGDCNAGMVLACFPAIQDAVAAEMAEAGLPAKPLSYETALNLPYLDAFVKEVMRLWPIAPLGQPHGSQVQA